MRKLTYTLISLALFLSSNVYADDAGNHQGNNFTVTPLTPSLMLLQGKGGNVLLSAGSDGVLLVDDDYDTMSEALKLQVEQLGKDKPLKYIINTHWHGDHTGGNTALGKGVDIIAHDNVRRRLNSHQEIAFFKMTSEPHAKHALPNLTYPDAMRIHFNDQQITLQHYPNGHTDGDTIVFFEQANVVHMGDHMFYPMYPFVDIGSGGNAVTLSANVAEVFTKIDDNTIVIPGHGSQTNKAGLGRYLHMLEGTIAEVKQMKDADLNLPQAQEKGLTKQWDQWNKGFIKQEHWIEFIYNSLK